MAVSSAEAAVLLAVWLAVHTGITSVDSFALWDAGAAAGEAGAAGAPAGWDAACGGDATFSSGDSVQHVTVL